MKRTSSPFALAATSLGLMLTPVAFAAGAHDHAPKFGGIVTEGKAFDAELVAKADLITVHLSDHGKPLATKDAKGKITLLNGPDKSEAELLPAGESRMESKGKFIVGQGTKSVVVITLDGKKPSTFRFALK